MMKSAWIKTLGMAAVLSLVSFQAFASEDGRERVQGDIWSSVHDFVIQCGVQPYNLDHEGKKVFTMIKSVCPELSLLENMARFELNGKKYAALLFESKNADEGDLNDIFLMDPAGNIVAKRYAVPAFGDIALALAGGDDNFRLVMDASIMVAEAIAEDLE